VSEIVRVLDALHEKEFVHGDIRPENIIRFKEKHWKIGFLSHSMDGFVLLLCKFCVGGFGIPPKLRSSLPSVGSVGKPIFSPIFSSPPFPSPKIFPLFF
jgi:serine/threonine protein kinase